MFKEIFKVEKLTTKRLCSMGLLLALTLILSMFFTIRIGSAIKISTKFLTLSVAAMLFGPIYGGLVGAAADILSYLVNPVSFFMPQITFVNFLYGFTYGIFLKNVTNSKKGYIKACLCVLFQNIFLHILLTSYFLMPIMGLSYPAMLAMRLPAAGVNLVMQLVGICIIVRYSDSFRRLSGGAL